jgi:hypothetical protein
MPTHQPPTANSFSAMSVRTRRVHLANLRFQTGNSFNKFAVTAGNISLSLCLRGVSRCLSQQIHFMRVDATNFVVPQSTSAARGTFQRGLNACNPGLYETAVSCNIGDKIICVRKRGPHIQPPG